MSKYEPLTEADIAKWKRMNEKQDASRYAYAEARNALGPLIAEWEEQAKEIKQLLVERRVDKAEIKRLQKFAIPCHITDEE